MAISIVLMSACPINYSILYCSTYCLNLNGTAVENPCMRPVYVKALYLQQKRPCFIVGEIALCMAFVLSSAYL